MAKLSVNVNKVALLRNQRPIGIPSVIEAAQTCIRAGAHGITVHPRPDERHIRRSDVYELAEVVTAEFNIEGNPFPRYMEIVRDVKPTQATLVPDAPGAVTSDHGWDLAEHAERLEPIVAELRDLGVRVSLFMDPDPAQIERAATVGADRVELYTEPYATAFREGRADEVLERYANAAARAQEVGLGVNAGHDLNLHNLGRFCAIPGILEVSIGHALIADALEMGLNCAVKAYLAALSQG
ncbi:MAG: pyridoxine 5'-phosphate synthase [Planctomycetota bacterium]|jgi:pyridoxine 5-phosphate synthase